jgi:hypothetical protein
MDRSSDQEARQLAETLLEKTKKQTEEDNELANKEREANIERIKL